MNILHKIKFLAVVFIAISIGLLNAQETMIYKIIGKDTLKMDMYRSASNDNQPKPAIVFFFGGGWSGSNLDQFIPHSRYFAKRGLHAFIVEYRVGKIHGTSPAASVRDAKSAIRYIRANAGELNVNPESVIASGGSAGGHLAAACAVIAGFNEPSDNDAISPFPNALVLFNPVIDNGPGGYGYERVKDYYKDFSPLHNLSKDMPPTLFILGTRDRLIPVETALYFQKVLEKLDVRCDVKLYEGEGHGFFNYRYFEMYKKTVQDADAFLQSLGYLDSDPEVDIK